LKWFVCAAIACSAIACSKPARPWVDRIEVDAFEGGEVISLSKEQLQAQLVSKLEAAKFNVVSESHKLPADVKPWRFKLAAGLSEPDIEHHTSFLAIALEVSHTGSDELFALDSRREVKPPAQNDIEAMQGAIRDAFDAALGHAVRESAALIANDSATDSVVVEKLKDTDEAVRDAAVRLLVRRHHKAALPELLSRLKADDLETLRGVVGLLVELRAPEAVNPLVEAARRRGPVFEREVVFAIGSIGGDDAEAYLDLVSSGHEDPLVRASAEQALSELRARKKKQNPTPGEAP
jgi:HEAT repeats